MGRNTNYVLLVVLFVVVGIVTEHGASAAPCPWADTGLVKWSTLGGDFNKSGAALVIGATQRILLDSSPGVVFRSISVDGEIVVANTALTLESGWIRLNNGGKFIAGAEESACRITNKVTIVFHGARDNTGNDMGKDPFDQTNLGSKGFAAATGSTFEVHGYNRGPTWTRLAKTARVNDTTIELEEAVYWTAGDVIVVASTDFGEMRPTSAILANWTSVSWYRGFNFPEQTEQVVVKSVSGKVVTLSAPLNYLHWGQGVQKAEVGLLTRRIKFTSDDSVDETEFGGHVIIRLCKSVHIEGAEFTRLGQKGVLARYPVHFHFLHDVIGEGIYFKDSSTHANFQRGLVVHDSHGLLIKDIVGYNVAGHMFFLEDGGERVNTFDHVLGLVARPVAAEEWKYGIKMQIIPTDNSPAIFWITNPNNTFVNCAAVGGRFGFWFLMPTNPTGAAATAGLYNTTYNPRRINLLEFHDNVAHSSSDTGFEWDNYLTPAGTTEEGAYSPSIRPVFYNLVAYKHRQFGLWGKSSMEYYNLTVMDNRRGLMVNGGTLVYDSYFVGESDNIGTPRAGFARSYPDGGGGNTTKICGHESYDNGGPQYSWNNVFENFVTYPNRLAGALCPLQTGPFMLDTKNRYINLTFINANEVHVGTPRTGDNEWGWTVLDIDGSITGLKGGGWIVSNQSHLINPSCVYKPNWEAYACPPHAEGFVQVLVTDQVNSVASRFHVNGSDISGAIIANTRTTRAVWYDQKDPSKFGKTIGSRIDCANGTEDGCFQFMNNFRPRRVYTIRFMLNDEFVRTPEFISVNMHSANPGDYVYVSIPYPASALPFNISSNFAGSAQLVQATSFDGVNTTSYYYDAATEHLYLYLKSTSTSFTSRQIFVDYGSSNPLIFVRTKCNPCNPTLAKLSTVPPPPPTPSLVENQYAASLQTCQVVGTGVNKPAANSAVGSAFFWFYPTTQELHYNIYHDLTGYAVGVDLFVGAYGKEGYNLTTRGFRTAASPLRGILTLSELQWADLVRGNLYVNVRTAKYPKGHLRGQIQFQGTKSAAARPQLPNVNPCAPTGKYLTIFGDSVMSPLVDGVANGTGDITNKSYTSDALCGDTAVSVSVQRGNYYFSPASRQFFTLNLDLYQYLEFYVKLAPGFGEVSLAVQIAYNNTYPKRAVLPAYISNHFIDENSNWTRVRMPFSVFSPNLPTSGSINITRLYFNLNDVSSAETFILDEIRFVEERTDTLKDIVTAAEVSVYDANICANGATTTTTTKASTTTSSTTTKASTTSSSTKASTTTSSSSSPTTTTTTTTTKASTSGGAGSTTSSDDSSSTTSPADTSSTTSSSDTSSATSASTSSGASGSDTTGSTIGKADMISTAASTWSVHANNAVFALLVVVGILCVMM